MQTSARLKVPYVWLAGTAGPQAHGKRRVPRGVMADCGEEQNLQLLQLFKNFLSLVLFFRSLAKVFFLKPFF